MILYDTVVLSQPHWNITDKLNLTCYVFHETKELLIITKMYIISINILMLITRIVIVIIIIIIIIIITVTVITVSIITVFVKSAWWIFWISCSSCATWLLTSNFITYFIISLFLFKSFYELKWLELFKKYWPVLKSDLFKKRSFN